MSDTRPTIIEREIARYGVPYGAVAIPRAVGEERVEQFKGKIIDGRTDLTTDFLRGTSFNPSVVDLARRRFCIVDVRFEDDPDSLPVGSCGRIVALCSPIPQEGAVHQVTHEEQRIRGNDS